MKAIVYSNYGSLDVLKCEKIEKLTPGDDEVLIKVRAASVNPLDWHLMRRPYIRRILFALSKLKVQLRMEKIRRAKSPQRKKRPRGTL